MGKDLIAVSRDKLPALYDKMRAAIAACFKVDDCQDIATEAAAVAAYYKQIKDDESMRQYLQIKIRAWRRIGEILTDCGAEKPQRADRKGTHKTSGLMPIVGDFNIAEYVRRIRAAFKGKKEIEELTDSAMRTAIRIMEVPDDFFEKNITRCDSIDQLVHAYQKLMIDEWETTPAGKAEAVRLQKIQARAEADRDARAAEFERQEVQREKDEAEVEDLLTARDEALKEVGITLERRDREEMHQTVFLLKKSIHDILRQAAFDNRMTMQAILRSGLMMWFVAHGYTVPTEDMRLPTRGTWDEGPARNRR